MSLLPSSSSTSSSSSSVPLVSASVPLHLTIFHTSFASYLFEKSVHRAQLKSSREAAEAESECITAPMSPVSASGSSSSPSRAALDAAWRAIEHMAKQGALPPLAERYRLLSSSKSKRVHSDLDIELRRLESLERCEELKWQIKIGKIDIVGEKRKRVAYYCIERMLPEAKEIDFRFKRFNEFAMLESLLAAVSSQGWTNQTKSAAPLPKPQWKLLDHFSEEFLEKRRKKLEEFLQYLCRCAMRPVQREILERFLEEGKGVSAAIWHANKENEENERKNGSKQKANQHSSNLDGAAKVAPASIPIRGSRINDQTVPDSILTLPTSSPSQLP